MSEQKKFYLTTTLPYVNSDPHIGFALELVQADTIVRYHRDVLGEEVFFNTGTDEHGQKIFQKAVEAGADPQHYTDDYAEKFKNLVPALGILPDIHFIRTTNPHHIAACQEFWRRVEKNGYIYKAKYKIKYCVGCELEKTESELNEQGRCLIHPHLEIEIREEENYFFKWSAFQKPLLDLYAKYPDFVVPDFRFNEIKNFVSAGLQDFSISRLKSKMSWGVEVPGDPDHVMYVWFDALINYISTLGWPEGGVGVRGEGLGDSTSGVPATPYPLHPTPFERFWPGVQIAGKDNLRQQSAMWQAMLMAAGLPTSRQILIHGFINSGGQKMSKSLGNVADPYVILDQLQSHGLTKQQATDALRYYLLREIPTFEDGDYTWEKLVESYNSGLANGIGNLTSRILKMAVNASVSLRGVQPTKQSISGNQIASDALAMTLDKEVQNFNLKLALDDLWKKIGDLDGYIQKNEPFKTIKTNPEHGKKDIQYLLTELYEVAQRLIPFLPYTSSKILEALKNPSEQNIPRLFPRILNT